MLDELQDSADGEGPFGSVSLVCQQSQQAKKLYEIPASGVSPIFQRLVHDPPAHNL